VPIYPGYVVATAASLLIGRPVKWIEDRTGNLISTGFARDFHMLWLAVAGVPALVVLESVGPDGEALRVADPCTGCAVMGVTARDHASAAQAEWRRWTGRGRRLPRGAVSAPAADDAYSLFGDALRK
jgi:hypothetical protein